MLTTTLDNEPIALKTCMVMQILLLQKLWKQSKAKGHSHALSRMLTLWQNGQISSLIEEGHSIQVQLVSSHNTIPHEDGAKKMGKIRKALNCIEDRQHCEKCPKSKLHCQYAQP